MLKVLILPHLERLTSLQFDSRSLTRMVRTQARIRIRGGEKDRILALIGAATGTSGLKMIGLFVLLVEVF